MLYLGLHPPKIKSDQNVIIHYPVIKIQPKLPTDDNIVKIMNEFDLFTHIVFTSKTAVNIFFNFIYYHKKKIQNKTLISVGKETAKVLMDYGLKNILIAEKEQAEGVVELLKSFSLTKAHILWPHSQKARPLIKDYLDLKKINYTEAIFYETLFHKPEISFSFDDIDSIFFTSPSTVDGFLAIFKEIPYNKKLFCIGPITKDHLNKVCKKTNTEQTNV